MGLFGKVFGGIMGQNKNNRLQEDMDFENQVKNDGYEYAGKRIADLLNEKITSKNLAKQFVLEELDGARQGNEFAQNFVKHSGYKSNEYIGAINKTKWEGEESELEHIQLFLRAILIKISDIDLMVKLSTCVVDETMKRWKLAKYSINNSTHKITLTKHELNDIRSLMAVQNSMLLSMVQWYQAEILDNKQEEIIAEIIHLSDDIIKNDSWDNDFFENQEIIYISLTEQQIYVIYSIYLMNDNMKKLVGMHSVYSYYVEKFKKIIDSLNDSDSNLTKNILDNELNSLEQEFINKLKGSYCMYDSDDVEIALKTLEENNISFQEFLDFMENEISKGEALLNIVVGNNHKGSRNLMYSIKVEEIKDTILKISELSVVNILLAQTEIIDIINKEVVSNAHPMFANVIDSVIADLYRLTIAISVEKNHNKVQGTNYTFVIGEEA